MIRGKGSRLAPLAGDIFTFRLEQSLDKYYFGRVVATDALLGNIKNVILIYIYRCTSQDKYSIPLLKVEDLLLPPIGSNAIPWAKGYFETIRTAANETEYLLPQHCFLRPSLLGGDPKYFDEYGRQLASPVPPVGFYGLSGIGSIDVMVSEALGILPKPM